MIFYLTLENVCRSEIYVSVRGVHCCEFNSIIGTSDCDSMKLIGADPGILFAGKTKNVTLIYPNLYLYGRQGFCTILIVHKIGTTTDHFFRKIPFNTKEVPNEFPIKRCPCYTSDLDPFRNCTPMDCPVKYSGHKNYFNSFTKYCESVPTCKSKSDRASSAEMYDILHNRCVNLDCTVSKSDLMLIEQKQTAPQPTPYIFGNTMCHHGCVDNKTGECVCHEKWISSITKEPEITPSLIPSHLCNIRTGSWTELNRDKLLLTVLVMVVMTSLCIIKLFFLICILHFCYKWARSRAKGENEASLIEFGFEKNYGTACTCTPELFDDVKRKKSKSSSQNTRWKPCKSVKSQTACFRTRLSDTKFQFDENKSARTIGVVTKIQKVSCDKLKEANSVKSVRTQTTDELLKSDDDSSSSSICSCVKMDQIDCYTSTFCSSVYEKEITTGTSQPAGETTNVSTSNYSINLDYDTEDLELECSSSSSSSSNRDK